MSTEDRKSVLVTGSNSGIGFAVAKQAALQNQRVILACRNAAKAEAARQEIVAAAPGAEVLVRLLDLSSFDSIRGFAATIAQEFPALDALVNNAGMMPSEQQYTQEGFEMQFGVNYLGHFLLTHLLLPTLSKRPKARVVHVSSLGHFWGRIDPKTFRGRKLYMMGLTSYGQSKLANVLFSHELARRLPAHVTSNVVHPGTVDSDFFRDIPSFIYKIWRKLLVPSEVSGRFIADMALAPEWEGRTGQFVSAKGFLPISGKTRDADLARRLYDESCRLTGVTPIGGA